MRRACQERGRSRTSDCGSRAERPEIREAHANTSESPDIPKTSRRSSISAIMYTATIGNLRTKTYGHTSHSSPPLAIVRSVAVVTPCQCRHTLISYGLQLPWHARPRFKIETTCVIGTCHMQSFHRSMFPTCLGSGCGD